MKTRSALLMEELSSLHSTQLTRILSRSLVEDLHSTSPDVAADRAPHALGRQKPSLSELELEGQSWSPSRKLRRLN